MASRKGRILCTEDDPDSREMLVFILTQAGYDVEGTDSAADALVRAKNGSFDLFLVDNWMPEMSGDELTREIRKFNSSTPILFYSGAGFESDKQSATDAGAQGYLVKPQGIADLVDEVTKLITEARIAFPVPIDPSLG
jgi:DNA-binding response OmpR family regulator